MRITFLFSLILLLGGCSHSRMQVVMLGPSGLRPHPVPAESLFVFTGEDRVLLKYQPIAQLSVGPRYSINPVWDPEAVEWALREKAGELGADGVIFGEISGWAFAGVDGEETWGTATAIRFVPTGSGEAVSAARSPREMRAIVVAPLGVPEGVPLPDSIAATFLQDIYDGLRADGYSPLPLAAYASVWEEAAPDPEGRPDPILDLKAEDEGQSGEQRILRSLIEEYGADGFLFPDLQEVEAHFDGEEAHWDGVKQKVGEPRSLGAKVVSGVLDLIISGEHDPAEQPPREGTVWAVSLVIQIENALGAHLCTGRGGVDLLEEVEFEGGIWIGDPVPDNYEVIERPSEELFQRRNRIRRAVRIALSSMGGGG